MRGQVFKTLWMLVAVVTCFLAAPRPGTCDDKQKLESSPKTKIFSGEPRLLVVHGYSTSVHWWAFLQRKIDRYMGGPGERIVEVQPCNKGGTPIAKWMDVKTGMRSDAWRQKLTPMIRAEKGKRSVVVLAQQSLQWVYGVQTTGIRNAEDRDRIQQGADAIKQYGDLLLEDGAAEVFIAMHIYKQGMEPEIGNERLALAELMRQKPSRLHAGPDVWTPTKAQYPLAFDRDRLHPNYLGAEIMAHYWFVTLLKHDGLQVPEWSHQEMEIAISNRPHGPTTDAATFRQLLKEWKIPDR